VWLDGVILRLAVSVEQRRVADRQRQTHDGVYRASTASRGKNGSKLVVMPSMLENFCDPKLAIASAMRNVAR